MILITNKQVVISYIDKNKEIDFKPLLIKLFIKQVVLLEIFVKD